MPSGRLGKAHIPNAQDVAKVYEVPTSTTSTFNINVVNMGSDATEVTVWISDGAFQNQDFESFLTAPVITDLVDYPVREVIGKGEYYLFLPTKGGKFISVAPTLVYARIQPATNASESGKGTITITRAPLQGDVQYFYRDNELYVRRMYGGGNLYTLENFLTGGSATSSYTFGFSASQPVQYAGDPADAGHTDDDVFFYAKNNSSTIGYKANDGLTVGTTNISTYSFSAGSVQNMRPLKSGRYLLGTTAGSLYWSINNNPTSASDWSGSAIQFNLVSTWKATSLVDGAAPVIGLPLLYDATSTSTYIYVFCNSIGSDPFVMFNAFGGATDTAAPTNNWEKGNFPEQLKDSEGNYLPDDVVDFYIDPNTEALVIKAKNGVEYESYDHSATWTEREQSGVNSYYNVTVATDEDTSEEGLRINGVIPEMEIYRGYTYTFDQSDNSNTEGASGNGAIYFSTASDSNTSSNIARTIDVTVNNSAAFGNSNVFAFDGREKAVLTLQRGGVYTFDLSDPSTAGHPLAMSATADGTHGGGTVYDTNYVASGAQGTSGGQVQFTVPLGAPDTLYFFCTNHSGMGSMVRIVNNVMEEFTYANLGGDANNGQSYLHYKANRTTLDAQFETESGDARLIYFTVPMDAPGTIYIRPKDHEGVNGLTISVADAPADQESKNHLLTLNVWDTESPDDGDNVQRKEIYADGVNRDRFKRFYPLALNTRPQDLFDIASVPGKGVLERTGVMASAGEAVYAKTSGSPVTVRVYGVEE